MLPTSRRVIVYSEAGLPLSITFLQSFVSAVFSTIVRRCYSSALRITVPRELADRYLYQHQPTCLGNSSSTHFACRYCNCFVCLQSSRIGFLRQCILKTIHRQWRRPKSLRRLCCLTLHNKACLKMRKSHCNKLIIVRRFRGILSPVSGFSIWPWTASRHWLMYLANTVDSEILPHLCTC